MADEERVEIWLKIIDQEGNAKKVESRSGMTMYLGNAELEACGADLTETDFQKILIRKTILVNRKFIGDAGGEKPNNEETATEVKSEIKAAAKPAAKPAASAPAKPQVVRQQKPPPKQNQNQNQQQNSRAAKAVIMPVDEANQWAALFGLDVRVIQILDVYRQGMCPEANFAQWIAFVENCRVEQVDWMKRERSLMVYNGKVSYLDSERHQVKNLEKSSRQVTPIVVEFSNDGQEWTKYWDMDSKGPPNWGRARVTILMNGKEQEVEFAKRFTEYFNQSKPLHKVQPLHMFATMLRRRVAEHAIPNNVILDSYNPENSLSFDIPPALVNCDEKDKPLMLDDAQKLIKESDLLIEEIEEAGEQEPIEVIPEKKKVKVIMNPPGEDADE